MQSDFRFEKRGFSSLRAESAVSVSELTGRIKGLLEGEIPSCWVRGEVSGLRPSYSGHVYFTLKDAQSSLSCALFAGAARRLKFDLKEGDEVLIFGKISLYAPRGNYQLIVEKAEPLGIGGLALALERLREKLRQEGLFDAGRKRPLPPHPERVAIITSPSGAAVQDILNVLGRRNSAISVLIVPVLVQGDQAPAQIIAALDVVNRLKLADLIVVARGGGSLEDLWCFNDEGLARAVSASALPVVSAVGHETDFTLCDAAADLRAPTPSAAAELISRDGAELLESLRSSERRMRSLLLAKVAGCRNRLLEWEKRLVSPSENILRMRKRLEEHVARMANLAQRNRMQASSRLEVFAGSLEALSPLKVLGRGYTLIEDAVSGELLKSVQETRKGQKVWLRFKDGKTTAEVF